MVTNMPALASSYGMPSPAYMQTNDLTPSLVTSVDFWASAQRSYSKVNLTDLAVVYVPAVCRAYIHGPSDVTCDVIGEQLMFIKSTTADKLKAYYYNNGSEVLRSNITGISWEWQATPGSSYVYGTNTDQYKLALAMGKTSFTILGTPFLSALPQSAKIDAFMTDYCDATGAHAGETPCACFREEESLLSGQVVDANGSIVAVGDTKFLPVVCFGRNCYRSGYRTNAMARKVCSVKICKATLNAPEALKQNITYNGSIKVFCGGTEYTVTENGVSSASGLAAVNQTQQVYKPGPKYELATLYWIIYAIAIFAILLFAVYYLRS